MKYLSSSMWDHFRKLEGGITKFDGNKFENLVRELLDAHVPGQWFATPRTRDGGKDVVDRSIPGDTGWAECKMYRAPLSLQIVSNTLVMAVIESDVKRIFIFSYSAMIENAKAYLGKFAAQTEKKIQVFDDELLEELILATPEMMRRYFPGVSVPTNPQFVPSMPTIRSHFSSDVYVGQQQLRFIDGWEKPRQHTIPINTPCVYEITLIARHASGTLRFRLDHDEFTHFEILNKVRYAGLADIELAGGQTLNLPIYLTPKASGSLYVPELHLRMGESTVQRLPELHVSVSALVRPILVGGHVLEALRAFEAAISSGNLIRLFAVYGSSGVGKSRYIDEAMTLLLKNGFDLHHFDGARVGNDTSERFIKRLLCSLWRLPDPSVIGTNGADPDGGEVIAAGAYGSVCEIVYDWKSEQFVANGDEVIANLNRGLSNHRGALIIDNVQAFRPEVVALLQRLSESVTACPGQATIILAFNQDELIFNDTARAWLHTLRQPQGGAVQSLFLPELNTLNAEFFLDSLFSRFVSDQTFSQAYPELVKLIFAHILLRPLDLFQFIKGLEDRGAIRAFNQTFTIIDFRVFHESLRSFDGVADRQELFDWRMRALGVVPDAKAAVAACTYLGSLSPFELHELGIGESSYEPLINACILRWDGRGEVDFYHPSFARYFIDDTLRGQTIDSEVKRNLSARLWPRRQRLGPSPEWFGLGYDTNAEISQDLAVTAAQFVDQDFSGIAQNYLVADRFLKYLHTCLSPNKWWPWLSAVPGAANIASQGGLRTLPARAENLSNVAEAISALCPPSVDAMSNWAHIIRETAGYQASSKGDSEGADRLLTRSLRTLDESAALSLADSCRQARAQLLNRRCVTLKNLGLRDAALAAANESKEIAISEGMHGLACLNWIDMGYVEYGLQNRCDQLRDYWDAACAEFAAHERTSDDVQNISVVVKLIEAKLATLAGRFRAGLEGIDALILDCRARRDHFYLLQGLATKGTLLLREALLTPGSPESNFRHVIEVAGTLEDLAASMDQQNRYRTSLYLRGKAREAIGDVACALVDYERAASKNRRISWDPEGDALNYDICRLRGRIVTPVALTTFAVGEIQLPLP